MIIIIKAMEKNSPILAFYTNAPNNSAAWMRSSILFWGL